MSADFESQGLELKLEVENFKDISKAACAFANAFGGRIVVGVSTDGKVAGAQGNLDVLQQRLEGAVQQVNPVPFHKIPVEDREGKKVVVVEVYPIGQGSFCTFNGIVYYRSGSTNAKLEGRTLQDYLIKRRILSFDESISKAKLEDVDTSKLKSFLKKRSPGVEFEENKVKEYLLNLGAAQQNGDFSLKNVGILFFTKEPSRFLSQNEVKLVRFKGVQPIDIIDSRFVNSSLPDNLKEAEDFIKKNTRTAFKIEKTQRVEVPEYPAQVIREALVNALAHRDYFSRDATQINIFDDRIEFLNPGTLPTGLSRDILGTLSVQRNPLTYLIMRDLGLVEGLATGIPRMREAMKNAGLPEPKFEELGSFFRVTIFNQTKPDSSGLNERQKRALAYLEKNASITSKTYLGLAKVSHPIGVSDLNELCKKGLLKRIGKTRGAYYVKVNNS
ncbi:putative DNA binding domain-containing protein [Candidatus Micrarchaeota archaeon]|nr:putative DNA binding domain-containing protein [Candidatus Micrarchaeota archaeon]